MWKHKYGWLGSLEFVGSTENICELNLILLKNLESCSEVMAKAKKRDCYYMNLIQSMYTLHKFPVHN